MFRIVCISSQTSELHKLIETVFPPAEYHVEVVKAVLDKAVQVAQEYVQAGYDIIISRGITSKILRQTMAVPVLNIDITYFDIISALNKASTYGYILEFFHYQGEAPQINDLMHMLKILKIDAHRLHLHSFTAGEDIERILNETEIDNAVILGTDPGPEMYLYDAERATVLGEYGGIGLPLENHLWQPDRNWGYIQFKNSDELTDEYEKYAGQLLKMIRAGFSGAVYTQTTDVEGEVNGLMTYDRKVIKPDETRLRKINREICNSLNQVVHKKQKL